VVTFKIQGDKVFKYVERQPPIIVGALLSKGEIRGYEAQRFVTEHLHFVHDGWGLDCGLVESFITGLPNDSVLVPPPSPIQVIKIYDATFGESYYTDPQTMKQFGIKEEYGDHGAQYILPRQYWGRNSNDYFRRSPGFVHLHNHSDYSLLDGMVKIEEYVYGARRMGMKAIALTDHGTLAGLTKFHKECRKAGVKPILGCEFYLAEDMKDKERKRKHLTVLAKNHTGYKNLLRLSTASFLEGFYYKPRVDRALMEKHAEGLIVTSGCAGGPVIQLMEEGKIAEAEKELLWWKSVFGDDYYIELHSDSLEIYVKHNWALTLMSARLGIPLIAVNDIHYTNKSDKYAHDVMLGVQKRQSINDDPGFSVNTYWFTSRDETVALFEEYQPAIDYSIIEQAISNTVTVADKIEEYEIKTELVLPEPSSPVSLKELCHTSLIKMGFGNNEEYISRVEYEVGVINSMDFDKYFLMLKEIIDWSNAQGIRLGAGRGSVAGSLVAYLLGITGVDPMKFNLLFERFLNPGRKIAPDIDLDFDNARRDEVVAFVQSRYETAKISTTVRMNGRGVIRDVCRVLGVNMKTADLIAKSVPFNFTIDKAFVKTPQFSALYKENSAVLDVARRLEGIIKTMGQHPAGVIISDKNVSEYMPLKHHKGSKGDIQIQGDMEDVDTIGLVKVDFLGSKTQAILDRCVKETGKELSGIPLDDNEVYRRFSLGKCEDIFQFNSELAIETLKKVKPENFLDLTAVTALIRPGAGDFIKVFASRSYTPVLADMEPLLADTRNVILYQEQSMLIAREIAGFGLGKADDLRKAIGKKIPKLMASLRDEFIRGGIEKGYAKADVLKVFQIIEKSQGYSFNKSHAISYTLSSYWGMWFKVHFPAVYAVAEMTIEVEGDRDKLNRYIMTAQKSNLKILPPDINASDFEFKREGDAIRCGLGMVKHFTNNGFGYLKTKRPFADFESFMASLKGKKRLCNKRAVQFLAKSGAFESLGINRRTVFDYMEGGCKKDPVAVKEWDLTQMAQEEYDAIGLYLTVDPLTTYKTAIEKFKITPRELFMNQDKYAVVRVAGIVSKVTNYESSKGPMAFVDIFGYDGEYALNIWAEVWLTLSGTFSAGDVLVVQGGRLDGNRVSLGKGCKIKKLN